MLFEELRPGINLETTDVEFKGLIEEGKSEIGKNKEISWLKTMVAFANTNGGSLFIGVENYSHTIVSLDHQTADHTVLMIHRQVRSRITPNIDYKINSIAVPDTLPTRYVLEVAVSKNTNLPVSLHEEGLLGIYIRVFGRTELAGPEQIRDMVLMSEQIPYDQPFTGISFQREAFSTLFQRVAERGSPLNEKELISKGFMSADSKLSKGALLFADHYQGSATRTVATLWPGLDKGSSVILASEEYSGNLLDVITRSIQFVQNHSTNGYRKEALSRDNYFAYPARSVTEGIVNAVGHRNYFMSGSQIEINIFQDRLEITSPGSLLGVRELQREKNIAAIIPRRRNEVICNTLDLCRYMEEKGSGFDKIADDYKAYEDKYQPYVSSNASFFTLTLPDLTFRYGVIGESSDLPDVYVEGILSGKNDERILAYCFTSPKTIKELAEYLGLTPSSYFRKSVVGRLVSENYLVEIPGKTAKYLSNPKRVKLKT